MARLGRGYAAHVLTSPPEVDSAATTLADKTGGAVALILGTGSHGAEYAKTGGAVVAAAGSGPLVEMMPRTGGAMQLGAGTGTEDVTHAKTGGAAVAAAGSGPTVATADDPRHRT